MSILAADLTPRSAIANLNADTLFADGFESAATLLLSTEWKLNACREAHRREIRLGGIACSALRLQCEYFVLTPVT